MKYKYIFFISILFVLKHFSFAQCSPNKYKTKCVENLSKYDFTFIKTFSIEEEKTNSNREIEYSFVFSKGTKYMLTFADKEGNVSNIEISLYDPQHKKIISNYNKKSGKFFPIQYQCTTTGVHYMTFKYHGSGDACGVSVLGFKR